MIRKPTHVMLLWLLSQLAVPAAEPVFPRAAYPPPPQPVRTQILIGAHNCPLWEADSPHMWDQVLKHPERTPLLGFYDQAIPEVADWETKWAVEHGINFFVYCWYRAGKGDAVQARYSSAIDAFLKSRFVANFKFTIMWENQGRDATWGVSGVTGAADLHTRLFPFWLTNYFGHPSYLKIDNQPVLFIYDARQLARDLGGVQNVPAAFAQMRAACRQAGFAGLYLLGEYRGLDPNELRAQKSDGLRLHLRLRLAGVATRAGRGATTRFHPPDPGSQYPSAGHYRFAGLERLARRGAALQNPSAGV